MKQHKSLYEVASEIFEKLTWDGMEAIVYAEAPGDTYSVGYRSAGSFGDPEHERSIACTVDLSTPMWHGSLVDWDIDPDLIGTTDLSEDLAHDYITGALTDEIWFRMEDRAEELEQTLREYGS